MSYQHVENPTAYANAIHRRMIVNGIVGRMQRVDDEAPIIRRLLDEVVEPASRRRFEKAEKDAMKRAERNGWDYAPMDYYSTFDISADTQRLTAEWVASMEWHDLDSFSFPEQLVLRYFKSSKGLSEKQLSAAERIVAEEPRREEAAAERREARQAADAASTHQGTVGERLKGLTLTVEFFKNIEGQYGTSRLIKMRDADNNVFVTFTTSAWAWEIKAGDVVTIDGTVKKHDTYEGTAQTSLTRTKRS